jgi:hypothetical protein
MKEKITMKIIRDWTPQEMKRFMKKRGGIAEINRVLKRHQEVKNLYWELADSIFDTFSMLKLTKQSKRLIRETFSKRIYSSALAPVEERKNWEETVNRLLRPFLERHFGDYV